jgi:ABC-2 type transport system ATP-binding protein
LQDSGDIRVFGVSLRADRQSVRQMLGVVFQSPSLDPKLTVLENIQCQATLYGLSGSLASERISESIQLLGLNEKINERTDKLSGGLKRRVELAKGMLHRPRLLLLDEPSTGLDPSARRDFWQALERLRAEFGTTIVLTTHLMEEAEECDSIAIIDRGQCIVHGTPRELRQSAGQQIVTIECENPSAVADRIRDGRQLEVQLVQSQVRVSSPDAADLARWVTEEFGERVDSVTIGRPSLVDVFISETGRSFY